MAGMPFAPPSRADAIEARVYVGLFAFVLLMHALWFAVSGFPDQFTDSDGYMRVMGVEALWRGGGWFDNSIPRANAPFGTTSHWTRPLDVLISLLALPLVPFLGVKGAIYWGGALSGPVLHGGAVAALAWAAWPLVGRNAAILAGIAATLQHGLMAYGTLTRADHHIFYAFLAALGFGCAIRALVKDKASWHALLAGLAAAAGAWIGIEGLAFAVVTLGALGLAWLARGENFVSQNCFRFAVGLAAGLGLALAIERGASILAVEYDRISIVHATLGALFALFFFGVSRAGAQNTLHAPLVRWAAALAGAAIAFGLWAYLFPKALGGPLADLDPAHVKFILGRIDELGAGATLERFPSTLGGTVLALPWLVWRLRRERHERYFHAWMYAALCVAFFGTLTAGWVRWAPYAGLFACLALGDMIARTTELIATRNISLRAREAQSAAVVMAILLGPLVVAFLVGIAVQPAESKADRERAKACNVRRLTDVLDRPPWSERSRVVLAGVNYGAEILYRTAHRVVGTPYHRAAPAMIETYDIFAETDDTRVHSVLARREVELIAICPGGKEGLSGKPGGFYDRLTKQPPAWVRPIALPPEASAFRVFEVLPEGRGR